MYPSKVFTFSPEMSPATSGGCKSHKCVRFEYCFGPDCSITVQSISKGFIVLESVIQVLQLLMYNILYDNLCITFLLLDPENWTCMDLPSSTHHINGWFRFSRKLLKLATHSFTQTYLWQYSIHPYRKWCHKLLPISCISRKRVYFGLFSGCNFSLMIQSIP